MQILTKRESQILAAVLLTALLGICLKSWKSLNQINSNLHQTSQNQPIPTSTP